MPFRSLPPPSKKRKVDGSLSQSIVQLEHQITDAVTTNSSLNALADLVDVASKAKGPQDTSKAIYALYRAFVVIIASGKLGLGGDENAKVVKAWLWERLNAYVLLLSGLLKDEEKSLRTSSLQILFSLQSHLSKSASENSSSPQFHLSHFRKIVSALLYCPPSQRSDSASSSADKKLDPDVLHLFHENWFSVNDDIRWFFLRESGAILTKTNPQVHPDVSGNLLCILEQLVTFPTEQSELNSWWISELGEKPPKPKAQDESEYDDGEEELKPDGDDEEDDWRKYFDEDGKDKDVKKSKGPLGRVHTLTLHQSLHNLPSHKAVFTRAWLNLLSKLIVPNNPDATKALAIRALNVMHRGVLPHLTRPVLVMDWIGACVDYGGTVGLLALNALYVLMKEYNLDYPSFYTRLYAFLDRDVLHLKHRARFFRMTEVFLSSTHLPATLLASFVKRLARLSLSAPPSAIVMVIPFTYNILKRHPALMIMIHRETDDQMIEDPFIPSENNPLLTEALSSSLWELQSHRRHYHSSVSTLAKIFSEAFTKPKYAMEDFLDHTYGTLFDAEANRKIKKEPPVSFEVEQQKGNLQLFGASVDVDADDIASAGGDVVTELWGF